MEDINKLVKLYSADLNNYKLNQDNKPLIEIYHIHVKDLYLILSI